MVAFYHRHIPSLSSKLPELYRLLKKGVIWEWTEKHQQEFITVKKLIANAQVLHSFNIVVMTDACQDGVGEVLLNIQIANVSCASATLTQAERQYSQFECELLGMIFAMKKFHKYVYSRSFKIFTDSLPTKLILEGKEIRNTAAPRLQRWALVMAGYDFEIIYIYILKKVELADFFVAFTIKHTSGG